jgi:two-component system sensor histidine kinase KdpD
MVIIITGFSWVWKNEVSLVNAALLYQVPVTFSAFWWGRWPSYFTALCGVAAFDFFFISPIFTFTVDDLRNFWSFITFLLVAFVIGGQTDLLRAESENARMREKSTQALYDFSREIAAVIDLKSIAEKLVTRAGETTGRSFIVLLPDGANQLKIWAGYDPVAIEAVPALGAADLAAVAWSYREGQKAGRTQDKWQESRLLHIPLRTADATVGILSVDVSGKPVSPEESRIFESWANLAAVAVERAQLTEKARQAELLVDSERLRNALFNAMSHDLRTPLASIIGSSATLLESEELYSADARRELLETIHDGSVRMERVVTNLLDTARLESGMMQLKYDWCAFEDIVGVALRQLRDLAKHYRIKTGIDPKLPLLWADCVLIEQVLVNLMDNAMKYSIYGTEIIVQAVGADENIVISVSDEGCGIPADEQERVFDKFYRIQQQTRIVGTGLGLSICKAIVQAHGGRIWNEKRASRGAVFCFSIPINRPSGGSKEELQQQ